MRSSDPTVDSREAMAMLFGGLRARMRSRCCRRSCWARPDARSVSTRCASSAGFETDEFRADPGLIATETDPSTRLTLSKRLRPDVELILSQSLRESGGLTAIVSYKPRRNIEMRAVSRDNLDRSVALRHEITFGGGDATDRRRRPTPAPKVSAVTISGEPGRPAEAADGAARARGRRHRSTSTTGSATSTTCASSITKQNHYEVARARDAAGQRRRPTVALEYRDRARARSPSSSSKAIRSNRSSKQDDSRGVAADDLRSLPARGHPSRASCAT